MSRAIVLVLLVVFAGSLFFVPSPAPVRQAAAAAGALIEEPLLPPPGSDWRDYVGPGDLVELGSGATAEVVAATGDFLTLRAEGAPSAEPVATAPRSSGTATRTVPLAEVLRVVRFRPLWKVLTSPPIAVTNDAGESVVRVRGFRMNLGGTTYRDHRLHARVFESVARQLRSIAASEGVPLAIEARSRADYPGVVLLCDYSDRELRMEVQYPDGRTVGARREWHPATNMALVPPALAILLAIFLRRPLVALAMGVGSGAVLERLMAGLDAGPAVGSGARRVFTQYLGGELLDPTRQQVLVFLVLMLGLIGLVTRMGGFRGLMVTLGRFASNARRSLLVTYGLGIAVFFDHYANTLLVGTTMRPITDRFRVAREKLAFMIDSTAAPVAGLSLFSTWIAFEVSTFSAHLPEAGLAVSQGYEVFLRTIPYRFYSLFTLFLVALIAWTGRDFGAMRKAEARARTAPADDEAAARAADGPPPRARMALVPLGTFLLGTLAAILVRGGAFRSERGLLEVLYQGSGSETLLIGVTAALGVAAVQAWRAGLRREILNGAFGGVHDAARPLVLLLLAWALGAVCREMGTALFLTLSIQEVLNPLLLPVILFLLSGLISFATGSPWSTMTILLPLVVGLSYEAGLSTPLGGVGLMVTAIGAVLEGAIFGDHCSPISDTTIMSSAAASCDHIDHVRTQAPYAVLAMVTAIVCGYVPVVIADMPPVFGLVLGALCLTAFVRIYGKRPPAVTEAADGVARELPRQAPQQLVEAA